MVPRTIYGVRLPYFDFVLSESEPNKGSINTARTLSSAIITPDTV